MIYNYAREVRPVEVRVYLVVPSQVPTPYPQEIRIVREYPVYQAPQP